MKPEMLSQIVNGLVKAYTTNDKEIDVTDMELPVDLGELKPDRGNISQVTNTYVVDGNEYVFHLIVRKDDHVILAHISE